MTFPHVTSYLDHIRLLLMPDAKCCIWTAVVNFGNPGDVFSAENSMGILNVVANVCFAGRFYISKFNQSPFLKLNFLPKVN